MHGMNHKSTRWGFCMRRAHWMHWVRCAALGVAALALAGCSSVKPWINEPLPPEDQSIPVRKSQRDPSILVAVTLSGGGARAAAGSDV